MSHSNISVFIPHVGCPNKCSFCNQNSITGNSKAPTVNEVMAICEQAFREIKDRSQTEIAFFGGSFTAINRKYMTDLLDCTREFIGKDKFKGIRISTRPDCIDDEILTLLKSYNVTSIELGAQSMDDNVLMNNDRGHTAKDIEDASKLIKSYGFELGLQLMVGLYKSTPELDMLSARKIIELKPDTVRIYPVVILEHTRLGELYKKGEYKPFSLDTAVEICSEMLLEFIAHDIKVIKLGLHASEMVEEQMLGGLYHPAFKELCENKIFYKKISDALMNKKIRKATVLVADNAISKAIGQNRCNIKQFEKNGIDVKIKPSQTLNNYEITIIEEEPACT